MEPPIIQLNTTPGSENFETPESPIMQGYRLTRYQYFIASPFYAGFDNFQDTKRKVFLDEFRQMSPNLKSFLTSIETAEAIFKTGQENNLEEAQIYQTAELVRELVGGKIFIQEMPATLAQKVNIDSTKASDIVNKIISKSFNSIVEDLKRIQRTKFSDKIQELQKQARPENLTQPSAKPVTGPPPMTPAQKINQPQFPQQPQAKSQLPPMRPPTPPPSVNPKPSMPPLNPQINSQPRPNTIPPIARPPQSQPRPQIPPLSTPKPFQEAKKPELPKPPSSFSTQNKDKPPMADIRPPEKPLQQNRPAFKIPDLGQSFSSGQKPPEPQPSGGDKSEAQKSLEAELEKVASVIDLRNKPPEK